jgi:CPA2 family monovalent cation:H+ antiporter-2
VGRNIAQGLHDAGIPNVIIELDPDSISSLRREGRACVHGDASNIRVLSLVNLRQAGTLAVTFPDPIAVVTTVKAALSINPQLRIIARVHRVKEADLLRSLGVTELISPEYEASFRFLKRLLNVLDMDKADRKRILARMRRDKGIAEFGNDAET